MILSRMLVLNMCAHLCTLVNVEERPGAHLPPFTNSGDRDGTNGN